MKLKAASYPERIRRIAEELSRLQRSNEVTQTAQKLRIIADELEHNLRMAVTKKSGAS